MKHRLCLVSLLLCAAFAGCAADGQALAPNDENARQTQLVTSEMLDQPTHASAQNILAIAYQYGIGRPQSYEQAIYWYEKAIAQGHVEACTNLAVLYILQSPPQYRNPAKGFALAMRGAQGGSGRGMCVVGECYQYGVGAKRNYKLARQWYQKSWEAGYSLGGHYLAHIYLQGLGVHKDWGKAQGILNTLAQEEDWGGALRHLGDMYLSGGPGIKRDYGKALGFYQRAAAQGNQGACFSLGQMYEKGMGVKADREEAIAWYRRSMADTSDNRGSYRLEQSLGTQNIAAEQDALAAAAIKRLSRGRENPFPAPTQ